MLASSRDTSPPDARWPTLTLAFAQYIAFAAGNECLPAACEAPAAVSPAPLFGAGGAHASAGSLLLEDIAAALRAEGVGAVANFGRSPLGRVQIACGGGSHAKDGFTVAIETDIGAYASLPTTSERARLRPTHLRALGWIVCRLFVLDWVRRRPATLSKLVQQVRSAENAQLQVQGTPAHAPAAMSEGGSRETSEMLAFFTDGDELTGRGGVSDEEFYSQSSELPVGGYDRGENGGAAAVGWQSVIALADTPRASEGSPNGSSRAAGKRSRGGAGRSMPARKIRRRS